MNVRRSGRQTQRLRDQVGERDGWVCYRCKRTIDTTLRYPHPYSASLEHIVELDRGGHPLHPDNATVSHLHCNNSAGATYGNTTRVSQPVRTTLSW